MKIPRENGIITPKIQNKPKNKENSSVLRLKEWLMWLYNHVNRKGDFENYSSKGGIPPIFITADIDICAKFPEICKLLAKVSVSRRRSPVDNRQTP